MKVKSNKGKTREDVKGNLQKSLKELEKARLELAVKKRELEIESSLERVRRVALGMKKPEDMLAICKNISKQLAKLGIKEIRNVQTAIFYESRGTYMNYEYYAKHDKTFITETLYTNHRIAKAFATKMLKGKGETYITYIKGKKVKEWLAYQKTTNVYIDKYLNTASSLNYYWHSLGPVALGISTYSPLKKEELELFQRFLKVFELAYRRYLDIEKANAQAREAQIEASLEKVRAAAMGMHRLEDLLNVCQILFREFRVLGFDSLRNAMINIHNDEKKSFINYDYSEEIGRSTNHLLYDIHPLVEKQIKTIRSANDAFSETYFTGRDLTTWKNFRRRIGEKDDPRLSKATGLFYYFYSIGIGSVGISTFGPIGKEKKALLKRFRNVFALSYQRYVDIAKAEAQAKEAAIELGLERVRARAMAMQHSDELAELVATVFRELNQLDFSLASCIIWINSPADKSNALWIASEEMNKPARPLQIVPFYPPFFTSIIAAWKAKDPKWIFSLTGTEKKKFQKLFFKQYPELPDALRKPVSENKQITFSASFNHFGALEIVATEPLTDEKFEILHRFGKVFDSSYTRFNDLQKAEAQAREAQIQLALERVRARTMAMQQSEELSETVTVMFEQFKTLGEEPERMAIEIVNEKENVFDIWATQHGGSQLNLLVHISLDEPHVMQKMYKAWRAKTRSITIDLQGNELEEYFQFLKKAQLPVQRKIFGKRRVQNVATFSKGILTIITPEPRPQETIQLLERFAAVFDGTYTRFLDLQKAEAQTREAQIEAALERVRSRSMGMQKSEELKEVIKLVYQQLIHLNIKLDHAGFVVDYKPKGDWNFWIADERDIPSKISHPYFESVWATQFNAAKEKGENFFATHLNFEEKNKFYNELLSYVPGLPQTSKDFYLSCPGLAATTVLFNNVALYIENFSGTPYTDDENKVLIRFGKVFEQTYTRFLDLQKAEAQAREAQIEASLERVRSRTMAMHKSPELNETAELLYRELTKLGMEKLTCGFTLLDEKSTTGTCYMANPEGSFTWEPFRLDHSGSPVFHTMYKSWKKKEAYNLSELAGQVNVKHNKYLAENAENFPMTAEQLLSILPPVTFSNTFNFRYGYLLVVSLSSLANEQCDIISRFARVFEQTYTRFLDLQKAETQAREAQIEASLERIRSRAMAMHSSDELGDAAILLYRELQSLGVTPFINCGYVLIDEISNTQHAWMTHADGTIREAHQMPLTGDSVMDSRYESWKRKEPVFHQVVGGEHLKNHLIFVSGTTHTTEGTHNLIPQLPDPTVFYCGNFSEGYLHILSNKELSKESELILSRFTTVFEITYRRFCDLQKAEAQTRESQIQLGLERARAQSMMMQHSTELDNTLRVFHEQVLLLGIPSAFSFLWLPDEENDKHIFWAAWEENNSFKSKAINYPLDRNEPATAQCLVDWKSNEPVFSYHVPPASVENYFAVWQELIDGVDHLKSEYYAGGLHYVEAFMKYGCFGVMVATDLTEDEKKILSRFAIEFERTYTRFLDLKKAEAQAREAQIEAALERVRSASLAMHTTSGLVNVVSVVYNQLTELGVKSDGVNINIIDPVTMGFDSWLSAPGLNTSFCFHVPYFSHPVIDEMYYGFKNKAELLSHVYPYDLKESFFQYLYANTNFGMLPEERKKMILESKNWEVSVAFVKNIALSLHSYSGKIFTPEENEILKRFARVFEQSYTRFLDLEKAEAQALRAEQDLIAIKEAKQKAEVALTELQTTQKQLIQAEKMASLGELTAGIAHEIQNPLNFVNNFSELNKELLVEMKDEIRKGNLDEVNTIADDVISNEEKINHHGKRADAIVKGMLQHSSSGSGKKEPTNINALADEYLRLAYHGLRAKDKTFNATMKTDFDESIGNINIIPQDIGRVILNLITNAFYVVNEKSKQNIAGYEPTVEVNTKKDGNKVLIAVKDNGNGILQKVLDKIFQPFFTTKPTGQGTGLGLSLSYDIVKAHGGEIKVSTEENEGTEFTIQLPLEKNA